jgi:hypothetical protein
MTTNNGRPKSNIDLVLAFNLCVMFDFVGSFVGINIGIIFCSFVFDFYFYVDVVVVVVVLVACLVVS